MKWIVSDTTGVSGGEVTGTIHVEQLVENAGSAYMALEALLPQDGSGEHLDIFSLGAIAYHLFSGQPPAANALELSERLRESKGLQISSVVNGAGENLQFLVQYSTHPEVSNRIDSARDCLEYLDEIQKELLDTEHDVVNDPAIRNGGVGRQCSSTSVRRAYGVESSHFKSPAAYCTPSSRNWRSVALS